MRFRQREDEARQATGWLLLLFGLTVLFTVVGVNLALALVWRLQSAWRFGYPMGFFETNTAVTLGFVLGGAWLESMRLHDGPARVATMIGGREVTAPQGPAERRLRNVVDEMAIATGLRAPRIFVLEREDAINALAAGWDRQDSVIAVTRGALERLNRDQLQGVVAHEFAHILNGDTRLNMRLIGMVFGLQMVFNLGRSLTNPVDDHGRRGPAALFGVALLVVGSIGWLAGRMLKAGVSRQREFLADAYAVQFTRQPSGIGDALRKIATQLRRGQRMQHVNAEVVSHLLLSSDILQKAGPLATHPSVDERLRRIFGRGMAPLPDDPITSLEPPPPELPPLDFAAASAGLLAPLAMAGVALAAQPADIDAESAQEALLLLLSPLNMTTQLPAAILACLVPTQGAAEAEIAVWRRAAGNSAEAERLLQAVRALPPRKRLPWFERLLAAAAALTPEQRMALRRDALALVQADGRLSLREYLQARVLHRMVSAGSTEIDQRHLHIAELAGPIDTVSQAMASTLPVAEGLTWAQAVLKELGLAALHRLSIPAVSELTPAINRLAFLSRMHSPALAKAWSEASPADGIPQAMADAIRCLCLLIDTPLPPEIEARFDSLPAPRR